MLHKDRDAVGSELSERLSSPVGMPVFKSQLYRLLAAILSKLMSGIQFTTMLTIILPT